MNYLYTLIIEMTTFISIGPTCNVKYQINKYKGKKETLFFDWLLTDMESVNSIFSCHDIDNILFVDNMMIDDTNISKISIKSLSQCVSLHDVGINIYDMYNIENEAKGHQKVFYFDKAREHFIEKYKRRYQKIIDYVQSDNHLVFVRYGSVDNKNKNMFIQSIKRLNPNCCFTLVSVNINQGINCIRKEEHFLEINLVDEKGSRDSSDWMTSLLNWEQIFKDIDEYM
jgi:hypothetical protein